MLCPSLVGTSLLQSLYGIADIVVAGHFIGKTAGSAVNNASLIMNMLTQIAIGLTLGGNILIGQYFGRGDIEGRRRSAGSLFTLCAVTGLAESIVFALYARSLLFFVGAPALWAFSLSLPIMPSLLH